MSNHLKILKRFGILVFDENNTLKDLNKIPYQKAGETFKQWCKRVFDSHQDIKIFYPVDVTGQTRMSTLKRQSEGKYLEKVFKSIRDMNKNEYIELINENHALTKENDELQTELEDSKNQLESITPINENILSEVYETLRPSMQDSTKEFLERYISKSDNSITAEEILKDLLIRYNNVVTEFRKKENLDV